MPGAKRTTKSVSYDDDDDFINTKKTRHTKSTTRQPPRKRNEKLSKTEQEELDLALQLSKATVPNNDNISIELPIISDEKESTTSQSTVSSHENEITVENDNDEHDENFLPKNKRMKREEEEDDDDDDDESNSEGEEEHDEPTPKKKPIRKTEETKKNSEISTINLDSTRSTTRGQQKSSIPTSEPPKKKSNAPIGFPTSKIIIPSLQTSRVGLSRKSSAIKPLHPNLNQRIVHE